MINSCAVIPIYNHADTISAIVSAVISFNLPCILVDDGSDPACAQQLEQLTAANAARITLLRHAQNRGKGSAVLTGCRHAAAAGFSHALQIDADGQHEPTDIPRFLACAAANPAAIIIGYPQYDEDVPKIRLYARYLTHIWIWINTLSFAIKDSMCGFRVYPLTPVITLAQRRRLGSYMDFDSEILVRLYWEGCKIINLPTRVYYPKDGISHFRLVLDNLLISRMHATLFLQMLLRLPRLLIRKLKTNRPEQHDA